MKHAIIFAALAALLAFSGCAEQQDGGGQGQQAGGGSGRQDDGLYDYEVAAGSGFNIELDCNPTTGYIWKVTEIDSGLLEPWSEDFILSGDCQPGMAGCGGTCILRFNALKAGDTSVTLVYCRDWECEQTTEETREFSIKIL